MKMGIHILLMSCLAFSIAGVTGSQPQASITLILNKTQVAGGENISAYCRSPRSDLLQSVGETVIYKVSQVSSEMAFGVPQRRSVIGSKFQSIRTIRYAECYNSLPMYSENRDPRGCRVNVKCMAFFKNGSGMNQVVTSEEVSYFVTSDYERSVRPQHGDITGVEIATSQSRLTAGDTAILLCRPRPVNNTNLWSLPERSDPLTYSWLVEERSANDYRTYAPYSASLPGERMVKLRIESDATCTEPSVLRATCTGRLGQKEFVGQIILAISCSQRDVATQPSHDKTLIILPRSGVYRVASGQPVEIGSCISTDKRSPGTWKQNCRKSQSWIVNEDVQSLKVYSAEVRYSGDYVCDAGGQTSRVTLEVVESNSGESLSPSFKPYPRTLTSVNSVWAQGQGKSQRNIFVFVCLAQDSIHDRKPVLQTKARRGGQTEHSTVKEPQGYQFPDGPALNTYSMLMPVNMTKLPKKITISASNDGSTELSSMNSVIAQEVPNGEQMMLFTLQFTADSACDGAALRHTLDGLVRKWTNGSMIGRSQERQSCLQVESCGGPEPRDVQQQLLWSALLHHHSISGLFGILRGKIEDYQTQFANQRCYMSKLSISLKTLMTPAVEELYQRFYN